jgi:hypothetical protein
LQDEMIYTIDDMIRLLKAKSPYGIYRAAQKYRETHGKQGIPNVQLGGPGSRVIFPKPMIDQWLRFGQNTRDIT